MNNTVRIATILTCHNRCEKTVKCLCGLHKALEHFNLSEKKIEMEIFLTDDGCTDGTAVKVKEAMVGKIPTNVIIGDGYQYWAGGMRLAWREALKREWDFYLLLNDDTTMLPTCLEELLLTHEYCLDNYKKEGLYSGITCDPMDYRKITYGGSVWTNKFLGKSKILENADHPQMCDLTNANILLVPMSVIEEIGIFYDGYIHGAADYDYANMARRHNLPVLITQNVCGECERDHISKQTMVEKYCQMTLKQRKAYFENPIHSNKDYMKYIWRTVPSRYLLVSVGRLINIYCPNLYKLLNKLR